MKSLAKDALGYTVASACALLVDMAVLWAFVHFLSWGYITAATASFMVGAIVSYELSITLAFKHHRLQDRRTEFAGFFAVGTLGLVVNTVVIFVMIRYFGLHYLIAKCIAAGFTFLCNFIARRQILFVRYSDAV